MQVPELTELPKTVMSTVMLEMVDVPAFTALHWQRAAGRIGVQERGGCPPGGPAGHGQLAAIGQVAVPIVFLGRDELGAPAEPIANPFFFQIERSDIFDASVGVRWRFAEAAVVSANALVPLNRQGLRADVIPPLEIAYAF